jgi:hypothetical protein
VVTKTLGKAHKRDKAIQQLLTGTVTKQHKAQQNDTTTEYPEGETGVRLSILPGQ